MKKKVNVDVSAYVSKKGGYSTIVDDLNEVWYIVLKKMKVWSVIVYLGATWNSGEEEIWYA